MAKAIFEGLVKELTGPRLTDHPAQFSFTVVSALMLSRVEDLMDALNWRDGSFGTTVGRVRITIEPIEEANSSIPGSDSSSSFRDTDGYAHLEGIT